MVDFLALFLIMGLMYAIGYIYGRSDGRNDCMKNKGPIGKIENDE